MASFSANLRALHRYRALDPWSLQDGKLLELINRGEFKLRGLRNRDLRVLLFSPTKDKKLQRRQAAGNIRLVVSYELSLQVPGDHL